MITNPVIEEHPVDTLVRVKCLIALLGSVDWDSPIADAGSGAQFLISEIKYALGHVIDQVVDVDIEHFAILEDVE